MAAAAESFPDRLWQILQSRAALKENNDDDALCEKLATWNEELEPILFSGGHSTSTDDTATTTTTTAVEQASHGLRRHLLLILGGSTTENDASNCSDWHHDDNDERLVTTTLNEWRAREDDSSSVNNNNKAALLSEILRTSKNWLRWYLQIHLSSSFTSSNTANTNAMTTTALTRWKSHDMLELYLLVLDDQATVAVVVPSSCSGGSSSSNDIQTARWVSQLLFYATYDENPVQGANAKLQTAYAFMVHDLGLFQRLLRLLVRLQDTVADTALALSLVRNVHNMLVTYAPAKRLVEETTVDPSQALTAADKQQQHEQPFTYRSVLLDLLETCNRKPLAESSFSENAVHNRNDDGHYQLQLQQQQAELALEILRTFYALRVGRDLVDPKPGDRLARCLLVLLSMHAAGSLLTAKEAAATALQSTDIALATCQVLMDASPTFFNHMAQHGAVASLLDFLDRQVSRVIEDALLDQDGAAAALPVLVVVYRSCQASEVFCHVTRERVFPTANERTFQLLVAAQETSGSSQKNMKPLDAPAGTLRYKLIRLLTWPQSHVKRFVSEILWTLSGSDPTEFTLRVGVGNALPFLGAKGLAQLPSHVYS